MQNSQLNQAINMISNAYLQYLLYTNKIIKSSSLSAAHTEKDLRRKLSFFVKTQWLRELEAEALGTANAEVRIRNGNITLTANHNYGWGGNELRTVSNKLSKGYFSMWLEEKGINPDDTHLIRFQQSGMEMSVGIDHMSLISEMKQRLGIEGRNHYRGRQRTDDEIQEFRRRAESEDLVWMKELHDEAFAHLMVAKDAAKDWLEFRNFFDQQVVTGGNEMSGSYRTSVHELRWMLKGLDGQRCSDNRDATALSELNTAVSAVIGYAEAHGHMERLHLNSWRLPQEFLLSHVAHLPEWRSQRGSKDEARVVINRAKDSLETISRRLRDLRSSQTQENGSNS